MAILHTPFPGFEMLLAPSSGPVSSVTFARWSAFGEMGVTLILGLLLSAAIPWLMTGLFLKPKAGPQLPQDSVTAG